MQVDVIDRHKIRREKQRVCDDSHDAHETRNVKIAATLLAKHLKYSGFIYLTICLQ